LGCTDVFSESGQSPKFTFCDDGGRAKIDEYDLVSTKFLIPVVNPDSLQTSKFRPGDQVYFCVRGTATREGPYKVASVPKAGKYILSLPNGQQAKGGNVVEERDLVFSGAN
jgi:hypothetical protein